MRFHSGLALGLGVLSSAFEPMALPSMAAEKETKSPLNEIVVTTNRRGAALAEIPNNIARLNAAEITFLASDHLSETLNRIPGMNIQRGNGQEHLTSMRSPVLTSGAGAGSFLYLEDGVPLRAAGFANVNGLFEAHSEIAGGVEIVRGPGSAFYGSNAVHGLINVLTPSSRAEHSTLDVSVGSFERLQMNATTSQTRGATGFFGGLTLTHEGGYRQHAGLDQQKITLRSDWDKGDKRLTFTLSGHNLNQETAGFIEGPDAYKDSELARSNPNPEAYRYTRALRTALRYEQDITETLTLAVTPYARWNEMEFLMHFLPSQALEENGHYSFGAQNTLYWDFGENRFILGADVEWTKGTLKEEQFIDTVFGTFTKGLHYDYDVEALVGALYAHGEWQTTEDLRVIAGLRVEATEYDYDNKTSADVVGRFRRAADRRDTFVTVTPKLGLVYQLNRNNALFANYARGARAPQTTDAYRLQIKQVVGEIDEEELDSFEIGARGQVGNTTYQVAAYAMRKKNFFFRDAAGFNVTDGKTRHWGVEADVITQLCDTLSLGIGAAYARHIYDFSNTASGVVDGNDVDTAPRFTANTRLTWTPREDIRTELEWVHMGDYYTDPANAHRYDGHDLVNVRASWEVKEGVEIFGAVRNLTNTDYAERADFAFSDERYFPGEERAGEIGIRLRF